MNRIDPSAAVLLQELRAFVDNAFPKKCSCGKVYETLQAYLTETSKTKGGGSFLENINDPESPLVDLVRNCTCGSTLMTIIPERRDISPQGIDRRERFGRLMDILQARGLSPDTAREELLKVLHGETSQILESLQMTLQSKQSADKIIDKK